MYHYINHLNLMAYIYSMEILLYTDMQCNNIMNTFIINYKILNSYKLKLQIISY